MRIIQKAIQDIRTMGGLGNHLADIEILMHWLHENTSVLAQTFLDDGGTAARIRVGKDRRGRLDAQLGQSGARIVPG